ncbi:hypothetical protein PHET_06711 [Paragonimus heterotremus]|uniref:SHSP domain-containing protein n=1 Tax=Paragonimus heterotremus TaxID=100268 RepID=A0A8J4TJ53_9TREM|nr:hypothetical protein PHET_06711 [Paragonimus heterotremus]
MIGPDGKPVLVHEDGHTHEQRRDMASKLRHTTSESTGSRPNCAAHGQCDLTHHRHPYRFEDVNKWIDTMDRMWNANIRKVGNGLFPLAPVHVFDKDLQESLAPRGDMPCIQDRTYRQMEAMRRHMGSVIKTDMRQTISGRDVELGIPECASVPHAIGAHFDYLDDVYRPGEDGRIHFKVRLNTEGYGPEDIQMNTSKQALKVHVKKSVKEETGSRTYEYVCTTCLPPSMKKGQFQANVTEGGFLTVDAPADVKLHKAVTFDLDH